MLTKGAIGNLINRYKAVLKKCHLMNTFGSLAVASMLVLGGAGAAEAASYFAGGQSIILEKDYSGDNIVGGQYIKEGIVRTDNFLGTGTPATEFQNGYDSDITIKSTISEGCVIGGNYFSGTPTTEGNACINSTSITVDNGTIGEWLVGGHRIQSTSGNYEKIDLDIVSTNINIKGKNANINMATIGGTVLVAGYYTKSDAEQPVVSVETSNINITEEATLSGVIAGGFAAFNDQVNERNVISNVTNSNVKISTSIINGIKSKIVTGDALSNFAIVAGGMAGEYKNSATVNNIFETNVENSNIVIENNSKINGNIAVGFAYVSNNNSESKATSNVVNSKIQIMNSEINGDIYLGGYATGSKATTSVTNASIDILDNSNVSGSIDGTTVKNDVTINVVNSEVNAINLAKGSVNLRAENEGKVTIKSFTPGDAAVTFSADGITNDAYDGDAQTLMDERFDMQAAQKNGEFVAEEGTVIGELNGTVENGVVKNVTEKPNETNVAMADLPVINHMLTRVEMNDLRKRMGDIRLLEGNTGVWARWDGGKLKGDSGITNDFHKIQLGADTATGIDSLRLGAAFSYTNSDMDFAKANAESDTLSFAGYGVWTADNGMFADVIARLAFIDTEVQTDKVNGDLNNLALSLSGEFGWRFDVCQQFFVEPQVELTYTYINSDEFSSSGTKFDFDDSDSLIGRAGLAAGWKLPNDLGDLYARASVVQEFLGDGKLTVSKGGTVRYNETDGQDTWFEYGIGANVKVTKNAYIFADVERTEGADIEEEWRGTVGIRYSF